MENGLLTRLPENHMPMGPLLSIHTVSGKSGFGGIRKRELTFDCP